MKKSTSQDQIKSFDFKQGQSIASKYEVISKLGSGLEGEVYLLREKNTNIERAGKFFFPHHNKGNRAVTRYAKKLHKLRHCPIVIQYFSQDTIRFRGRNITFLVSEFVEGEILENFLKRQPGKRLPPFQAMHLLYALAKGIEQIHAHREYHGDLHTENIIIQRFGLGFELKVLDMYNWDKDFSRPENIRDDIFDIIKIFYESLGGKKIYANLPREVKSICCGKKKSLVLKKFRTASRLRRALENLEWK